MVKREIEREKKRKLRKKRLGLVGLTAYCSKCGKKDILGNKAGTWGNSDCCNAEYLPTPMLKSVETSD